MSDGFSAISSNSMSSALAISDEEGSLACFQVSVRQIEVSS